MPRANGLGDRITAFVAANPGSTAAEIGAGLNFSHNSGTINWTMKQGRIFQSGPRHSLRYYPTAEEAEANHERLCALAVKKREERMRLAGRRQNLTRRAKRHEKGVVPRNTRRAECLHIELDKGATLALDVKVQVAKTPKGRFEPDPGFERVITGDWMLRRQGVDPFAS